MDALVLPVQRIFVDDGRPEFQAFFRQALASVHSPDFRTELVFGAPDGRPFALAFLTLCTGHTTLTLEVAQQMWAVNSRLQIVFCLADAELGADDLSLERLFFSLQSDRFLIVRQPIYPLELRQLLRSLLEKARLLATAAPEADIFQNATGHYETLRKLHLLEACLAQINDVVLITDATPSEAGGPKIVFVNEAFARVTGYTRKEVLGRSPSLLQGINTSRAERERMTLAIQRGKPVRVELLNYARDGHAFWVDLDIVPVKNLEGICTNWVGIQRDISEKSQTSARIEHLAYFDPLTGLANRRLLDDRLQQTLAACARHPVYCALVFLDLDNFKALNDGFGHDKGDALLAEVAQRLQTCVREEDTIARFGGDEFVVLVRNLGLDTAEAAANAETVGRKIVEQLSLPYVLKGASFNATASVGITLFNNDATGVKDLLQHADVAMYQAKTAGKNTLRFYDPNVQQMVDERVWLGNELRLAIERNQLSLHFQPQIDGTLGLTAAEALLRWERPDRGFVAPVVFIALAEQLGLIKQIGRWVLEAACLALVRWSRCPEMAHLKLAVNVSSQQFQMPDFVSDVLECLQRTGARADRLKLELTESMLIHDLQDVDQKMASLKSHGIGLALDDFGTGYSSLSYLRRLSLDQLKIDTSFVRNLLGDPEDAAIVRAMLELGESLGLEVVAEGVETPEQKAFLLGMGCTVFQGYLFSQALPEPAFEDFVRQGPSRLTTQP
jgi:diguanylate cyclase (GGDEF)-like protein/PAS domain S-box-containing protein